MNNNDFCKAHTEWAGEPIDNINQINRITFWNGTELKQYVEHHIRRFKEVSKFTHTYLSINNNIVRCYPVRRDGLFKVLVKTENNGHTLLKRWHLKKIK